MLSFDTLKEKNIAISTDELEVIFNNAQVGLMYITGDRKLIKANQTLCEIFGYDSTEDMIGISMKKLHLSEKRFIEFGEKNFKTLASGAKHNIEYELKRKDGTNIWCSLSGKILDDKIPADIKKGVLWVVTDITLQKKQKEDLEKSQLLNKNIISSIPDLLWMKDKDGVYLACNSRFEDFFGAKEKEILGRTDYDFVEKELADFFREHDIKAMNENKPISNFEEISFASDGHKEYLHTTKTKIIDSSGNLFGVLGIGRDISKIKKLQNNLRDEKNRYKKLMENSSDAIFIVNTDGYIIECSNLFKSTLGYTDKEISKLHISDFETVHSKELIKENIKKTEYTHLDFESKYKKKDGSLIDVSVHAVRIEIDGKDYIYSSFRDISELKKTEEFVKKTNEILKMIATGKPASEVYDEIALMYEKRHPGMRCSLLELEDGKLLHGGAPSMPKEYCDAVHGLENGPDVGSCGTSTYTGKRVLVENIETDPKWKDIKAAALPHGMRSCWSEPIINSSGDVLGAFGMYYNYPALPNKEESEDLLSAARLASIVMERDQAQKHIYENQKFIAEQTKLASMGEMIGNIAHQWRQPLSVISTNASGLKLDAELSEVSKEDILRSVDIIMKQASYLSNTIDNFKNFIKTDKLNKLILLKDVLTNTLNLVDASLQNNYIKLILDIEDDLEIFGNKNELTEAFINIINNSKDVLKSVLKNSDNRFIFIKTKKIDTDKIEIKIYDNGGGIDENIMDKLFEPYFTTKHKSQGTGLGLSIADKIIRDRHHGIFTVTNKEYEYKNNLYKGACFTIVFEKRVK